MNENTDQIAYFRHQQALEEQEITPSPITSSSFSQAMERCGYFGAIHRLLCEYSDLPLPAALDVEHFGRVLDVACGDGTWLLEMARLNPELNFVGVDADSWAILAASQAARARRLGHARFLLANIHKLSQFDDLAEFSANHYDLVHGRFLAPYTAPCTWQQLIAELWRLCTPGGYITLTESAGFTTNSSAWSEGCLLIEQAITRAGYTTDVTHILEVILADAPCEHVQTITTTLDISAGTPAQFALLHILDDLWRMLKPFLLRMQVASEHELTRIGQGMVLDLGYSSTFRGTWTLLTVTGQKPRARG